MPKQDRLAFARAATFGDRLGVGCVELLLVHMFAFEQSGIPGFRDFPFLQHLTHDDFDVLVVNLHTLQAVNVLHFVDHVVGQGFDTHNRKDVMRRWVAVHDVVALLGQSHLPQPGCACPWAPCTRPCDPDLRRTRSRYGACFCSLCQSAHSRRFLR